MSLDMYEYHKNLPLPDQAVKVNGTYLENSVIGYRTLSVKGRETLDVDISEIQVGQSDGSKYKSKRDNTRTLEISYALIGNNEIEAQKLMNKLKSLLYTENSQFIFKDEADVYYTGTVENISADPFSYTDGYLINGTISIHCTDPYKYSVEEKVVYPTEDNGYTFEVDYKGTKVANPRFEFTMNGDNGYLGLLDTKGNVLEFGNIDEADGETVTQNEQLMTLDNFYNAPDDTSGTDYLHPAHNVTGTLTKKTFDETGSAQFLSIGEFRNTDTTNCNGGLRTVTIPADSQGGTGCKNWYAWLRVLFRAVKYQGQTGEMCINFLTDDNKVIAALNWYKNDRCGNTAHYELWANGKCLKTYDYTCSHIREQNAWSWAYGGYCDLRKEGSKLTFYYFGDYPVFYVPEIENMVCTKIQIAIKDFKGRHINNALVANMGFYQFKFTKLNVNRWIDSRNLFQNGDNVVINLDENSVKLNGLSKPAIGKLGNNWDGFVLQPGYNQIKFTHSYWASKPNAVLKYREVFL